MSPDVLSAEARVLAAALRSALPADGNSGVHVSSDKAASLVRTLEELAEIVDGVRNARDFGPAASDDGCATVIRCGETIRIIGEDGRGVFATINARMQQAGAGSPPDVARVQRAARKMQMAAREFCGHAVRAAGKGGLHEDVVRVPLGAWSEWEAAVRAVEEGA